MLHMMKLLAVQLRRYDAYVNVAKAFTHAQGWQVSPDMSCSI